MLEIRKTSNPKWWWYFYKYLWKISA